MIHDGDTEQQAHYSKYDSSEESAALAKEKGWLVTYPSSNELYIDADTDEDLERFTRLFARAQQTPLDDVLHSWNPTRSKSGVGWHVRVILKQSLDVMTRIALQSSLGSDPRAGLVSICRVLAKDPNPVLFFEKPDYESTLVATKPVESVTVGSGELRPA